MGPAFGGGEVATGRWVAVGAGTAVACGAVVACGAAVGAEAAVGAGSDGAWVGSSDDPHATVIARTSKPTKNRIARERGGDDFAFLFASFVASRH